MKIKSTDTKPPEADVTPMIDIVFQLIAFFMVISNFEQQQADERVSLPRDQLAKPPEVRRENAVVLNLGFQKDRDGNIIDPTPRLFFGGESYTVEESATQLRKEAEFYTTINVDIAEVTVEIRADKNVDSGLVQKLIQMCQEDGIQFQRFALKATQASQ